MADAPDISCALCQRKFTAKKNLYRYIRTFHPANEVCLKKSVVCSICQHLSLSLIELQNHIKSNHPEIKLTFQNPTFYDIDAFKEWKNKIEMDTQSSFVKQRKDRHQNDGKVAMHYYCHRSGEYNPISCERKRNLKVLGTQKIGFSCPAHITAYKEEHDEAVLISVEYQSVHIGHKCEVGRMPLSSNGKQQLAGSMKSGIPKSTVLKNISRNFSPTKRIAHTTRKDLHNICRDYKIEDESVFHNDDVLSVDIRIQKMLSESKNSILLYKPVGNILENYPAICKDEFLLGIMNDAQMKMLELYGSEVIMIDSTHGTNQYGFQLTTIMIQDGDLEGFPVAILYSTRIAAETFVPFFEKIKSKIPTLMPRTFMSDDAAAYYNAFKKVFVEVEQQLICAWHIRRAWNVNLCSKVKDSDLRDSLKIELQHILQETDTVTFENISKQFVEKLLQCDETQVFGAYFQSNYMNRVKQWAYCYRRNAQINTNMKLERWHREIKYEEACGKIIKRMGKSLGIVLSAITKKLIGRAVPLERGKLVSKVIDLRNRHANNLKDITKDMVIEITPKLSWAILSTKSSDAFMETYSVSYEKECNCNIACDKCNICIHCFSCTCHDYIIKFIMCKHIHFICCNFQFGRTEKNTSEADNIPALIIDTSERLELEMEERIAISETLRESRVDSIVEERASVITSLQNLITSCSSPDMSLDQLKTVKKAVCSLEKQLKIDYQPKFPTVSQKKQLSPLIKKSKSNVSFPSLRRERNVSSPYEYNLLRLLRIPI